MRRLATWMVVAGVVLAGTTMTRAAGQKDPSATSGWVKLPAAGATSTDAYVSVDNPGMYAIYLLSATADVAGSVEIRQTGKDAAIDEVTVPAYGSIDMDAKGIHLLLKDLKKPLAEGDKVSLTVVTELGIKLNVQATVKKE